ncbi:MAG: hypothetical protein J0L97_05180 [Alphaproteobacteria bacterium]|nr:hypothetical protein [Alphaproteobacteria bacterium]
MQRPLIISNDQFPLHPIWPVLQEVRERIHNLNDEQLAAAGVARQDLETLLSYRINIRLGSFADMRFNPASIITHHSQKRSVITINEWFCDLPISTQLKILAHEFGHALAGISSEERALHYVNNFVENLSGALMLGAAGLGYEAIVGVSSQEAPNLSAFALGARVLTVGADALAVGAAALAVGAGVLAISAFSLKRLHRRHEEHYCDRFADIVVPEITHKQKMHDHVQAFYAFLQNGTDSHREAVSNPSFENRVRDMVYGIFPFHPPIEERSAYSDGRLGKGPHLTWQEMMLLETSKHLDCIGLKPIADYLRRNSALPLSDWGMRVTDADKAVVAEPTRQ